MTTNYCLGKKYYYYGFHKWKVEDAKFDTVCKGTANDNVNANDDDYDDDDDEEDREWELKQTLNTNRFVELILLE